MVTYEVHSNIILNDDIVTDRFLLGGTVIAFSKKVNTGIERGIVNSMDTFGIFI